MRISSSSIVFNGENKRRRTSRSPPTGVPGSRWWLAMVERAMGKRAMALMVMSLIPVILQSNWVLYARTPCFYNQIGALLLKAMFLQSNWGNDAQNPVFLQSIRGSDAQNHVFAIKLGK